VRRNTAKVVYRIFLAIACLNLIDAVCTFYFLANDIVEEANPLMRYAWEYSPALFLGLKLLGSLLCIVIGKLLAQMESVHRIVRVISIGCIGIYSVIITLHAYVFMMM
jgi:Domain of unknown function (DUF5658)